MPMDRSRYPQNWPEIAHQIKEAANWHCEDCNRPCRRPGESWIDFVMELLRSGGTDGWYAQTCEEEEGVIVEKVQRFTLTVAHLNQDPGDNSPSNLRAFCSVCHLKHDAPFRQYNRMAKLERKTGQGNLFDLVPCTPAGHGKDLSKIQTPIRDEVI